MDQWPADILIYAVIAVGLVLWLRSILGTRHGEERQRPDPFAQKETPAQADEQPASDSNIIPMPGQINTGAKPNAHANYADEKAQAGLLQIALADRQFDAADFVEKAQDAFAMIITAFAEGDRETLRSLLADPVYKAFESALREREKQGQTVTTEVHAIRNVHIIECTLNKKRHALVTLRFTADETCVVRDQDGQILSGHPDHVTEMIDVWVFGRDIKSSDPRWLLMETRDDHKEDHNAKTPIPEA